MDTKQAIIDAIKQVFDPEIPVNVYDLGLIYDIQVKDNGADITMSLTSQGCPSARELPTMVREAVQSKAGLQEVNVQVVWDPAWTPERISPEGKKLLNLE